MTREIPTTKAQAKAHGANVRGERITFPSVAALEAFASAWKIDERAREHERRIAAVADPGALPLPVSHGGPEVPFGVLVDAYVRHHGVTYAETYRRISGQTGNSAKGIALRVNGRGGEVWRFSSPY